MSLIAICFYINSQLPFIHLFLRLQHLKLILHLVNSQTHLFLHLFHKILYLLDSYGVSDDFYHELSMINNSLPRSYRVKNLRKSLSSNVNIKQIEQGWYVPFGDYLQLALSRISQSGHNLQSPIEIKISGDGAPFYRSSSFILLSFSFPSLDPDSSSASGMVIDIMTQRFIAFHLNVGTHTLAVINGEEKYEVLKNSFSPAINEINDIIVREQTTVDGVSYGLNLFLGRL